MAREGVCGHIVASHVQLLVAFSSGAQSIHDASGTLRQMLPEAHSDVYSTPEAPEQADVLDLADDTLGFSPIRPRQLCFGHTCKGIVKRPKGVVCTKRAASDVGRRVRVKWIPHYVKARNPPKSKMLWFKGTVIEHCSTRKKRTHRVRYEDKTVAWHDARGLQQEGLWVFEPKTSSLRA